jgi:hypothetical protein
MVLLSPMIIDAKDYRYGEDDYFDVFHAAVYFRESLSSEAKCRREKDLFIKL